MVVVWGWRHSPDDRMLDDQDSGVQYEGYRLVDFRENRGGGGAANGFERGHSSSLVCARPCRRPPVPCLRMICSCPHPPPDLHVCLADATSGSGPRPVSAADGAQQFKSDGNGGHGGARQGRRNRGSREREIEIESNTRITTGQSTRKPTLWQGARV